MGDDFGSTHWSLVLEAARGDSPHARAALEELCRAYHQPLYQYALKCGRDAAAAADATQEFFARQVVTGAVFKGAAPGRGRFRAWLVAALKHHLHNARDHEHAEKRGGGQPGVPLEEFEKAEAHYRTADDTVADAERHFDREWGMTVLKRARALLAERYRDRAELFGVLQQFLPGDEGSLADAAAKLGKSHGATKTAVSRFRDDFGDAVRFEISRTVSSPAEVDDEVRALIDAVSRNP